MKKNLESLSLALLLAGTSGCSVIHHANPFHHNNPGVKKSVGTTLTTSPSNVPKPENYSVPNITTGNSLGLVANDQMKYNLESLALYDNQMYAATNSAHIENQLPFALYHSTNTSRLFDFEKKLVNLDPEVVYIPQREKNSKGEDAHRAFLSAKGKYGMRAKMTYPDISNDPLGTIISNQDAAKFGIKTERIMDEEYFVALVEVSKRSDPNAMPFYFLPKKGTQIRVMPDGKIILESQQGLYRPLANSPVDYFKDQMPANSKDGSTTDKIE